MARERTFLLGEPNPAATEFTIGAPATDMALPAAAPDTPSRGGAGPTGASTTPDTDIAVAATAPAVEDAVPDPLGACVRGHATGDPARFRDAFLPTARIGGIRDGAFGSWCLEEYCALFPGEPAPDEPDRSRRLDTVGVHGTVATATMTLTHGADTFTDVFLLVRADGGRRIADKACHRHRRTTGRPGR